MVEDGKSTKKASFKHADSQSVHSYAAERRDDQDKKSSEGGLEALQKKMTSPGVMNSYYYKRSANAKRSKAQKIVKEANSMIDSIVNSSPYFIAAHQSDGHQS